jgi:hypothetical protein
MTFSSLIGLLKGYFSLPVGLLAVYTFVIILAVVLAFRFTRDLSPLVLGGVMAFAVFLATLPHDTVAQLTIFSALVVGVAGASYARLKS